MKGLFVTLDDVPKEEKLSVVQRIMDKATQMGYVNQFNHDAGSLLGCMDSQSVIALYSDGYFCASDLFLYGKKREPLISAYDFLKEDTKKGFTLEPEVSSEWKSPSPDDAWDSWCGFFNSLGMGLSMDTKKEDNVKGFKFDMSWIRGEARIELMRVIVMKLYEMGALKGQQWANMGMAYHKVIDGKLYSTNTDILWDFRELPEVSVNAILRGKLPKEKTAYKIDLSMYPEATRKAVTEAILKVAYEKGHKGNGAMPSPTHPIYSLYFEKNKSILCSIEKRTYNEMQSYIPLSVEDALEGNY